MKVKTLRMRVTSLLFLGLCSMAALEVEARAPQVLRPALVRGKIERQGKPNYPAAYVPVELIRKTDEVQGLGEKRRLLAYTGPDGVYYFRVAPGSYVLKVKISDKESKSYLIQVKAQKTVEVGLIVIR
jgi:hypothetical protein